MSMESPPKEQQQPDQPPPQPPPPPPLDQRRRSKPPTKVLVSRSYTIAVLLISLVVLYTLKNTDKENKDEVNGAPPQPPPKKGSPEKHHPPPPPTPGIAQPSFKISELGSLRSVLTVAVIGIGCNLYQLGMLIHWKVTGKDLAQNKYNIFFNYYCDKAVALLLAASVGAGIGSMLDIKQVRPSFQYVASFFSLGQISTTLLATATISTSVSSTSSSEALQEYKRTLDKGEKAVGMLGPWANKAYHYCCACCT